MHPLGLNPSLGQFFGEKKPLLQVDKTGTESVAVAGCETSRVTEVGTAK